MRGAGPLGGMHSALRLARNPLVWIVGSDMPFISAEEARRLMTGFADGVQAVIPLVGERPIPLHGLYDSRCAEIVAALLTAGVGSMEGLLGRIHWLGVPAEQEAEQGAPCFSFEIHSEADYERAESLLHLVRSTG
ncbi:molybdenum cofactor guanylyltransferase [Cohnella rhizosphaerae]|uniref:NTP transferase domain-containing protein n=1 Tax=Cohnella rhizosphaerae TaxID=1457232 RepID=A0A9X4QX98_9BACL|nr:NTP transferase domain-containing protein [Cohnella rhizosphaerae]MDG0814378.1 NTP transferase domain-containing protein [Cohnella rhizosphaerae]